MSLAPKRLTSAELILLAAHDLPKTGSSEFTEWQLSVATWKREPARFGMRGFEKEHPDHKRVMKEIMGKAPANPIQRGLLEKVRPNYYCLTPLGRAEATRLGELGQAKNSSETQSASDLYDAVAHYTDHRVFQAWLNDPDEPRSWLGASAFLGIAKNDAAELRNRVRKAMRCATDGLAWCEEHNRPQLTRGPVGGGRAIARAELVRLQEFVSLLEVRFATQMNAIRKRGESASS